MSYLTERTPNVSVIIPTYNSSGTLRFALQTVLLQDYNDFEVLVVGDGCTDDSDEIVTSFSDSRLHWFNLPSNSGGPSLPRNEGIRRAKGRYIAYLGHDDLWFPWHLSGLVDCIEKNNSDFVYSLGAFIGPKGLIGTFSIPHRPRSLERARALLLSPSNWLHQKRLTEVMGSWSSSKRIRYDDDRVFLQRIFNANVPLNYRRQLSVLKFPSGDWHMYALKTGFPQAPYVEAMHQDAENLRDDLLLELATRLSKKEFYLHEKSSIYRFLRGIITHLIFFYGCNRWPMNRLLDWRRRRRSGLSG